MLPEINQLKQKLRKENFYTVRVKPSNLFVDGNFVVVSDAVFPKEIELAKKLCSVLLLVKGNVLHAKRTAANLGLKM